MDGRSFCRPAGTVPAASEAGCCRGAGFSGTAIGEALPRYENHVRINKQVNDAWGIPVLHIEAKYGDNEAQMAKDAVETMEQVCHDAALRYSHEITARFRRVTAFTKWAPRAWGTTRKRACSISGTGATTSRISLSWTAAVFVTAGSQNPTMTILALSMRPSEYAAGQMRAGNL